MQQVAAGALRVAVELLSVFFCSLKIKINESTTLKHAVQVETGILTGNTGPWRGVLQYCLLNPHLYAHISIYIYIHTYIHTYI